MNAIPARVATRPARPYAPSAPRAVPVRRKRKAQHRLRSGVVWIVVFAVLLSGVVALNVAALRQNMQIENFANQRVQLIDQTQQLRSQLSQAVSPPRIERLARTSLKLVQMPPGETTYISLGAGGK